MHRLIVNARYRRIHRKNDSKDREAMHLPIMFPLSFAMVREGARFKGAPVMIRAIACLHVVFDVSP